MFFKPGFAAAGIMIMQAVPGTLNSLMESAADLRARLLAWRDGNTKILDLRARDAFESVRLCSHRARNIPADQIRYAPKLLCSSYKLMHHLSLF